jgi:hypothetical protein
MPTDRELRRDHLIEQAVAAGKFPPSRREHWAREYDRDPAATEVTLAALAPALVGVRSPTALAAGDSPYPRELFPELARADRRAGQAAPVQAASDDQRSREGLAPHSMLPAAEDGETELSPELVGQWSRQMFPETVAAGAAPSRVHRAND